MRNGSALCAIGKRGHASTYFVRRGTRLVILLAGGDKRTQDRDIKLAIELARGL